ncbi:hypothetical protein NF462_10625 [Streptococcus suis]|nr:hypothetical protein [Streptococcus suis]
MGSAARMSAAVNLMRAKYRGVGRGLLPRRLAHQTEEFAQLLPSVGYVLE